MPRISPGMVGFGVTALAGVGLVVYLLVRPQPVGATSAAAPVDDEGARAAVAEPPPSVRSPPPPAALVAAPASAPAAPPGASTSVALKQRALLMADHDEQLIEEADEQAFVTMKLPDSTRLAVRRINYDYATATHAFLAANPPTSAPDEQQGANIAKTGEADRVRRAALKDLLGADGVSAFESTEHAAVRRLQRKYGSRWAEELEQQAPRPGGLPPSPH